MNPTPLSLSNLLTVSPPASSTHAAHPQCDPQTFDRETPHPYTETCTASQSPAAHRCAASVSMRNSTWPPAAVVRAAPPAAPPPAPPIHRAGKRSPTAASTPPACDRCRVAQTPAARPETSARRNTRCRNARTDRICRPHRS